MEGAEQPNTEQAPPVPVNETPGFFLEAYQFVVFSLQRYGWFIVFGIIALLFLKSKLEPHINKWRKKREIHNEYLNYNPDEVERRQSAMDAARQRMQDQLDAQAAIYAEEQKKKEDEKRKAKIEDWNRHKEGKGYRSKYRATDEPSASSGASGSQSKAKPKAKPFRPSDYNPLTGTSSSADSCAWRPARRGGNMGGG